LAPEQRRRTLGLLLNELADLRAENALDEATYATLSGRLVDRMRWLQARPRPAPAARLGPMFWLGMPSGWLDF
jgi:hypothetical protein